MASKHRKRSADPLAMQIYAALLGNAPKVAKTPPPPQSRIKFDVRLETISSGVDSPFRTPSIKESLERAAAGALSALGEASERLRRARTAVKPAAPAKPAAVAVEQVTKSKATPIVLIGPTAVRGSQRMQQARDAHAAAEVARRSAAA